MKAKVNKVTLEVIQGDILKLPVDGVVVVTDPNLTLDSRLIQEAGESIQAQTATIGWSDVGTAAMTDAGKLTNLNKIIHAVGPRWGEGSERGKLANLVWSIVNLAEDQELKSIALPAVSVGTFGYPVEASAQIVIARLIDFTFEDPRHLRNIKICLSDTAMFDIFLAEFRRQIEDLRETGEGKVRV